MTGDVYLLTYCGIFGRALKVSHKGREIFLPCSQIKFRRPAPADFMKPIRVEIPQWLAQAKGLL